jgi:hypothetical protein
MRVLGLIFGAAGVILGGCSSLQVSTDYDRKVDFSKLRTWAWYPTPTQAVTAEKANPRVSPLTLQRAREAIQSVLTAKGYALVPDEKSDFLVAVHAATERHVEVDPFVVGWGWGYGWGPYWDGYWGPPAVYAYDEGILIVDLIENKPDHKLVWRGLAHRPVRHGLSPEEREARIREAVDEMLSRFPPH